MKYDRPIWELMADCARELPPRFRFRHVQRWFEQHYPDANERTVRAHLVGLTESAKNSNRFLAEKQPLFRRVEHGEYEVILRDPAPQVDADDPVIALVGFEDEQGSQPTAARDLFRSREFRAARRRLEADAVEWFVLSTNYGLLRPDAWLSPYRQRLVSCSAAFVVAWASWVTENVEAQVGGLSGRRLELLARQVFAGPLMPTLSARGGRRSDAARGPQAERAAALARRHRELTREVAAHGPERRRGRALIRVPC